MSSNIRTMPSTSTIQQSQRGAIHGGSRGAQLLHSRKRTFHTTPTCESWSKKSFRNGLGRSVFFSPPGCC